MRVGSYLFDRLIEDWGRVVNYFSILNMNK